MCGNCKKIRSEAKELIVKPHNNGKILRVFAENIRTQKMQNTI